MKKFHKFFLLGFILSIMHTSAQAHDFAVANSDGVTIYYTITSSTDLTVAVSYRGTSYRNYSNEYSGDVRIPSVVTYNGNTYNVTTIGDYAFRDCTGLTSIDIPNSVTCIGNSAFSGCKGLTSIEIPNSVTTIGEDAFSGCSGLTSIEIPNSVTSIGDNAFYHCTGLTSIEIPNSVTSIGKSVFSSCSGLTSIEIPNSVTSIGEYAFYNCTGLSSVTIGNSVTSIGSSAFCLCSGLASLIVESGNPKYDSRDNCNAIIETTSKTLVFGCKNTVIPYGMISIGDYAFNGCTGLTSIEIPNSLTSMGEGAFANCDGLNLIISKCTTPPTCCMATFSNVNKSTCILKVPEGSLSAYKNTSYWKEFSNIEEIIYDKTNTLSINNLKSFRGVQIVLPIALNNENDITGFQFDLYLPAGINVATKANGKMMISTTERMDGNYTISGNQMGSFVRIVGYSVDGDAFTGTEGDILNITLNISEEVADGDYTIYIEDIVLSDTNNSEYHPADIMATLTMKQYTIGDADDSGAININDVVCIINYILNRSTGTFIEGAADVDENGTININDVVVLINKYILHKDAAPQQDEMRVPLRAVSVDNNYLHLADIEINPGETKEIQLLMTNADVVTASQGNIKLPAGLSFVTKSNGKVDAKNIDSRSEDFTLSCAIQADGSLTFAQYSGDGFNYDGNSGGIFTFKIKADENATAGTYSINLSNVVLSIGGVGYDIPNRSSQITISGATGIDSIGYEELLEGNIYTLDGKKVEQLHRGVNIVRQQDGTVRKVVVK